MSEQEETTDDVSAVAEEFASLIESMEPEHRAVVLTELATRFCMSCGFTLDEDGDCTNEECEDLEVSDLDTDEDEDEDEDDEDDEDEDEDDEDDADEEDDDDSGDDGDPDEEDDEAEGH